MSSPDCKRQKLTDDVNSVANMSKVSTTKNVATQTANGTSTASTFKKLTAININLDAQKFEDVAKSDGFVDKTMLIEELLQGKEGAKYVKIFAPSKFGKTLNLDMIRLFCDIEDKNTKTKEDVAKDPTMEDLRSNPSKNMKVFLRQFEDTEYEECLILKQENFFIQHFGRHPVVLFNFKDCRAKNQSEAIFHCAQQVKKGYLEHKYLENSKEFQSDDAEHIYLKNECTDWILYSDVELESLSLRCVMDGLKNLIKSLRIHWGRNPVFLVDEVDKPCVYAIENKLSEKQVCEIGTTITNVICSILKTIDKQLKLEAALLTGICRFASTGLAPMDNTLPVYFLSDDRFSEYYGLTTKEVNSLVERLCGSQGDAEKTNKIISDINAKYNGYNYQRSFCGEDKKDVRYCLFSVLNYMKNPNTKQLCFWSDGGFLTGKLVPVLGKSDDIMSAIQILLYDDSGTIEIDYETPVHAEDILKLYRGERAYPDAVFNFFLQRGYLAHNLEKPIKNVAKSGKIYVRIPNLEIKSIYKNMFELYYGSLPKDIQSKLTSCGQIFKSLPTQDSTEFRNSLDKLSEHLKCIFKFMKCTDELTICCHILAILKHHAEYEKGETKYTVKYFDECVWGRHGNFAIIFGVKYNCDATGEPGTIGWKAKSSLAAAEEIVELLPGKKKTEDGSGRDLEVLKSQIENYVLIGLAVDGDYTTHMLVFRDTSDWKNVIQVNPENHVAELISTHLKSEIPVV